MTDRTSNPLACPWCGVWPINGVPNRLETRFSLGCVNPSCEVQPLIQAQTTEECVRIWNKRTPDETSDHLSDDVACVLTDACMILDVVKGEWAEAWSEWDQGVRDRITRLLIANHEARPGSKEIRHPGLAAQIDAAKKRIAAWPADVRAALGLPEEPSELPEALRDPVKNLERGRELLKEWGPTPVTDAALAESKESPLARAVRIARGDTGPPPEPVRFAEKASEPFEKHPDYCMAHGGHLVDSPACKLAREREKRTENGSVPQQPPVDNDHVAPGCEKFDE